MTNDMLDRFRGCLLGGGAGDALGYAVEFYDVESIFEMYGEEGIKRYAQFTDAGCAMISDDTQMTLYTANGLLCGAAHGADEKEYPRYIYKCYLDWLRTQKGNGAPIKGKTAWLNDLLELHALRAPGGTCLRSLSSGKMGSVAKHINDSKGCGGVMRAAPVGLLFEDEGMCARIGAESAAITHGNALGYLPAAVLASTVRELVMDPEMSVRDAVLSAKNTMMNTFPHEPDLPYMCELIDRALDLAAEDLSDDLVSLYDLGEGWVGEEALAVAIYCAVKYDADFEKCMIAAVNHSGDSDSTGAIAGNILGAKLGMKGIPEYYLKELELREVLVQMADDLYAARMSMGWKKKYL